MDKNITFMDKTDWQIKIEKSSGLNPFFEQRRITKDDPENGHKKGDIVTVKHWGTFGCWDTENKWVDFYNSEAI